MKASEVFPKAAKKMGMEYLGSSRDGRYLFGYFGNSNGDIFRSFYFSSIKLVVGAVDSADPWMKK